MKPEESAALLAPFPKASIGSIDRGNGVSLDYVGHAATTKRLLEVDPSWVWEPVALNEFGAPYIDANGGLWIRLTVCGVTRLGYGDAGGKRGGNAVKEAIGDAIRNAAMRFGVALDLWAKEEIETTFETPAPVATDADVKRWIKALGSAASDEAVSAIGREVWGYETTDEQIAAIKEAGAAARARLKEGGEK